MPSRKRPQGSRDEDVEREPPFKFRRSIHFEDCKRDELMLTESERKQLQKVLATHDVALALVETDDESLESEDDKKDKKSMLKSKLGNTRGSRRTEVKAEAWKRPVVAMATRKRSQGSREEDVEPPFKFRRSVHFQDCKPDELMLSESEPCQLERVLTTLNVALNVVEEPQDKKPERKEPQKKEKKKEEKVELQKMLYSLSDDKLATLVKMMGPLVDVDEDGYRGIDFERLTRQERVRFRAIVEQLMAEKKPERKEKKAYSKDEKPQKKEKNMHSKAGFPQSDPSGTQKAKAKDAQPAKPAKPQAPDTAPAAPEREISVEELLAEYESLLL